MEPSKRPKQKKLKPLAASQVAELSALLSQQHDALSEARSELDDARAALGAEQEARAAEQDAAVMLQAGVAELEASQDSADQKVVSLLCS